MTFQCPECRRVSHNPNDEEHGYCGACHKFFVPKEIETFTVKCAHCGALINMEKGKTKDGDVFDCFACDNPLRFKEIPK